MGPRNTSCTYRVSQVESVRSNSERTTQGSQPIEVKSDDFRHITQSPMGRLIRWFEYCMELLIPIHFWSRDIFQYLKIKTQNEIQEHNREAAEYENKGKRKD